MSWFKKAQFIPSTLDDRELLNEKIRYFEAVVEELETLAKVVFQNGTFAKNASYEIANHKKMSSYPAIRELLLQADKIALDSPWKYASLCQMASDEIRRKIAKLIRERKKLIEETLPARMKGWVDKHDKEE
jgi:hypothetical protein